jgi:hypothetical protein
VLAPKEQPRGAVAACPSAPAQTRIDFHIEFAPPQVEAPFRARKDGIMLPSHEIRRIALEALTSERTAKRAYQRPGSIRESTRVRLTKAAERLRLPPPPVPSLEDESGAAAPTSPHGGPGDDDV